MSYWCTIAPIVPAWRGPRSRFVAPVDLGVGVRLIPVPGWLQDDSIKRWMSLDERESLGKARFALSIDYEAKSVNEQDPMWRGKGGMSKPSVAVEKMIRA